jgi:DNA-binding MarR family transcriptional regulator
MNASMVSDTIAATLSSLQKKCWRKDRVLADEMGLSVPEFNLLTFFINCQSLPIKNLAEALNVTPGRITHLVTALEDRKLLKRTLKKQDRRVVQVSLTKKGIQLVEEMQLRIRDYFSQILESLKDEDKMGMLDALKKLDDLMEGDCLCPKEVVADEVELVETV